MSNSSKSRLALSALVKLVAGLALICALLFGPAGSFDYIGAWRLLGLLFVPMLLMGTLFLFTSPDLLRRRLSSKEKRKTQSGVVRFSGLIFLVGFIVAGLDWRWGWSTVGATATIVSSTVFLIGYLLYFVVMKQNEWLSRTVEVAEGQQVVTTGLYGIVRHPMYMATLLMFLAMPVVLGSWWALGAFVFYIPVIVVRTLDEERLLRTELKGYSDYCRRVRWRILPYIW